MWNEAIICGYAGRDPEVRTTNGGDAVTSLSVATTDRWKDKGTGEPRERTEWHRIVLFGRLAEIAGDYVKKGTLVLVRGQIQTRKWTDQSGNDRYTTEIVVSGFDARLKILGGGGDDGADAPVDRKSVRKRAAAPAQPAAELDDEIPF
jgi:single-strand DNA-binding protein